MPAINVARTDTFEQQRVKINEIGSQIFNISQGGSDLSTGNLRLGDGSKTQPSLAFISKPELGIFRESDSIGFTSSSKKLLDIGVEGSFSYKNFVFRRREVYNDGLSTLNSGENYDQGSYTSIPFTGGTGEGALANIEVAAYTGTITNNGENYAEGTYGSISLAGGNGNGAQAGFVVEGIDGNVDNVGSGYIPGVYANVGITGGSGTNALAELVVVGSTSVTGAITNSGSGYTDAQYQQVAFLNAPTSTYVLTSVVNPGTPPPNSVYQIDGNTQQVLNLVRGNTYQFDISDASNATHPFVIQTLAGNSLSNQYYTVIKKGSEGTPGSLVQLVIDAYAPLETIKYNCSSHDGMGANINITAGSTGSYGRGLEATVTVNSGSITIVSLNAAGSKGYQSNDALTLFTDDVGGTGNGFEYTINTVTYNGTISSFVVSDNGSNYLRGDVLSIDNTNMGGFGSGFQFTVDTDPGVVKQFTFSEKGTGYQVNDVLTMPGGVTNVNAFLGGNIPNVFTTLASGNAVITVASTVGIIAGMDVTVDTMGSTGNLPNGTTVQSVDSATQITLSQGASVSGDAYLVFSTTNPPETFTVASATGIFAGQTVVVTSGTGQVADNTAVDSVDYNTNTITISPGATLAGNAVISFLPSYGSPTTSFEFRVDQLGSIESFNITDGGNGYIIGDQLSVNPTDLTQPIDLPVQVKQTQKVTFTTQIADSVLSVGDIVKRPPGGILSFGQTSSPQITPTVVGPLATTLSNSSRSITLTSTAGITAGMVVSQAMGDTGVIGNGSTVESVDSGTEITLSVIPLLSGAANLSFTQNVAATYSEVASTTSGSGQSATFNVVRDSLGNISSVNVASSGYFYAVNDTVTINGSLVGGTNGVHDIELQVTNTEIVDDLVVYSVSASGGFIDSITIDANGLLNGNFLLKDGTSTPIYTINTATGARFKTFIDTGSGFSITPDLTLYSGNTYKFDFSDASNSTHVFQLSKFPGGTFGRSLIENVSGTLDVLSQNVTVSSSAGIVVGMLVTVTSGIGELVTSSITRVSAIVDATTITLDRFPSTSGAVVLRFVGEEYTDGVTKEDGALYLKVIDSTPTLYYYCSAAGQEDEHEFEGGDPNDEAVITIDLNNPKTFGSGFLISVLETTNVDTITSEIKEGKVTCLDFESTTSLVDTLTATTSITTSAATTTDLTCDEITVNEGSSISVNSPVAFDESLSVSDKVTITHTSGNITTTGTLKAITSLNINDVLTITSSNISSLGTNDLLLTPAPGRIAKIDESSALIIPVGDTNARPGAGIREDGAIRFNTETNQYEGYTASTTSWSSLGGVRDLDGNTYILAELNPGDNDNTLWFYNDGVNTAKLTPEFFDFRSVKKLSSTKLGLPSYSTWTANTPVTVGQYIRYQNNLYEVTGAGSTASTGNEPTHTSGVSNNGTAQFTWYSSAVSPLSFSEILELRVAPEKNAPLIVNGSLKLGGTTSDDWNAISTVTEDLYIRPADDKKVVVDTDTHLAIPSGNINQRNTAAAIPGSIRFNTEIQQFEGYSGTNWSSLGGVRDVDGNTYIIPESAPAANENILYFYNDNINTVKLSKTSLDLTNIDTITTSGLSNLSIDTPLVTFNSNDTTVDNREATRTFISSSKQYLDLGLSSGLNIDPVLRLDDQGDVYLNTTFGTGTFNGVKVFDGQLKEFELADYAIKTNTFTLGKGAAETSSVDLYSSSSNKSCKVTVVSKSSSGKRSMAEFHVIDDGTDIFYNEFGSLNTSLDQFTASFDFTATNDVRISVTLSDDHANGDIISFTVLTQVIK